MKFSIVVKTDDQHHAFDSARHALRMINPAYVSVGTPENIAVMEYQMVVDATSPAIAAVGAALTDWYIMSEPDHLPLPLGSLLWFKSERKRQGL